MIRKQISAFIHQRNAAQVFKLFWEKKKKKTSLNTGMRCFWSFKSSSGAPSGKN